MPWKACKPMDERLKFTLVRAHEPLIVGLVRLETRNIS
jgi:hypothetical protein